jgi:anti-sigma B factor antagonist
MLTTEQRDGVTVLTVDEARLDAATCPRFRNEAAEGVTNGGRVVLDASKLEFVDSTGLGALVSLLKTVGPSGTLVVAGAGKQILKLLAVTKLDRVFTLENTPEEAVRRARE